jgi:speckle-type POZ protein
LRPRLKLEEDHLSDVDVVAGDQVFHCHKVILASSSDVFEAMFSHSNVKECREGKIVIDDDDPSVVKLFLEFIYSDDFDGSLDEDSDVQMHEVGMESFKAKVLAITKSFWKNRIERIFENIVLENAESFRNEYSVWNLSDLTFLAKIKSL